MWSSEFWRSRQEASRGAGNELLNRRVRGSSPRAGTKIEFISGSESTPPTAYCQCIARPQNTSGGLGRPREVQPDFRLCPSNSLSSGFLDRSLSRTIVSR